MSLSFSTSKYLHWYAWMWDLENESQGLRFRMINRLFRPHIVKIFEEKKLKVKPDKTTSHESKPWSLKSIARSECGQWYSPWREASTSCLAMKASDFLTQDRTNVIGTDATCCPPSLESGMHAQVQRACAVWPKSRGDTAVQLFHHRQHGEHTVSAHEQLRPLFQRYCYTSTEIVRLWTTLETKLNWS